MDPRDKEVKETREWDKVGPAIVENRSAITSANKKNRFLAKRLQHLNSIKMFLPRDDY